MWDRRGGNDVGGRGTSAHKRSEKSLRRIRSDDKDDKVKTFPEEPVKGAKWY